MIKSLTGKTGLISAVSLAALLATSWPVTAQDTLAEARIRRMEAEIRALQRQVFPASDGKVFSPEIAPGNPASPANGAPATTAVTDLQARIDAVESQMQRLTAQVEENGNRLRQIEARIAPAAAASPPPEATTAAVAPVATPTPAATAAPTPDPAPSPSPAASPTPKPTPAARAIPAATPATRTAPSAQRLAAVRAIPKPQTEDAGDDEYSYGYRLWEAKFYPEAAQQLKLMIDRYPRHVRLSFARNLLGRSFLDDGKPREAATWFLQNFQADKRGDRAPDSLLFLAEAMNRLKDTNRACIALAEFTDNYPREMAGRLKVQYDATRAGVKCS